MASTDHSSDGQGDHVDPRFCRGWNLFAECGYGIEISTAQVDDSVTPS